MVNAVYLLQIDAFYSFSGTYFFLISGEKLNKPSDAQVVLMPHRPLWVFLHRRLNISTWRFQLLFVYR